jgi:hypothetical protein
MEYRQYIINGLRDIRFWICLFFIFHLLTIALPPLEPGSTWRQTDGLMVARNFYERDANILYPSVDVAGNKTGIVGCEFPVLNYLIYTVSLVFGYESWYGRFINLIVSSIGVLYFFRIIRNYFGELPAFNASMLVLVSVWFTYNRTNIPDTFAASLCIVGLYYAVQYLRRGKLSDLILFTLLGGIGCLAKISAACLLTTLAIPLFLSQTGYHRKIALVIVGFIILSAVYAWYFVWVPYLSRKYDFGEHFFMGMSFSTGASQLLHNWPAALRRFYNTPFKYTGFLVFLAGLIIAVHKKLWLPLLLFIVPFTAFTIVILKCGFNFLVDAYYVIMFIPPMAFIAGCGLAQIKRRSVIAIALAIVSIEGVANQLHVLEIRQPNLALTKLENELDAISLRNDLIVINSNARADPTPMYFAHRRGWVIRNSDFTDTGYLSRLKNQGCKYAVIIKKPYGDIDLGLQKIFDSTYFKIYKM